MKKKDWQDMQQIETDFAEWLVKNKVNDSIGVLIETCVEFMEKPYYEWYHDGCPYDDSGMLRDTGEKIKDRCHTLKELTEAYTGVSSATGISHLGLIYDSIEKEFYDRLRERVYSVFLLEYIAKQRQWLLSFDKISQAITDENKRTKYDIEDGMSQDEAIKEYFWFEDTVGWSNVDLECKVEEVIETLSEDIFNQIQERYKEKSR